MATHNQRRRGLGVSQATEEFTEQLEIDSHQALRHGLFRFDDSAVGSFVYVPRGFNYKTMEGLNKILSALGLNRPDLVFRFPKCSNVVPNTDDKDRDAYSNAKNKHNKIRDDLVFPHRIEKGPYLNVGRTRVQNFVNGLADACTQSSGALFLVRKPDIGNDVAEMACEAARNHNVPSLGLFNAGRFTTLSIKDTRAKEKSTTENQAETSNPSPSSQERTPMSWEEEAAHVEVVKRSQEISKYMTELKDLTPEDIRKPDHEVKLDCLKLPRKYISAQIFEEEDVVPSAGDQAKVAIQISGTRTKLENLFLDKYRFAFVPNGLAGMCSHRLVFPSAEACDEFESILSTNLATGFVIAGSEQAELSTALTCLQSNQPLLVLKNTGLVSYAIAKLIDFAIAWKKNETDLYRMVQKHEKRMSRIGSVGRANQRKKKKWRQEFLRKYKEEKEKLEKNRNKKLDAKLEDLDEKESEELSFCRNVSEQVVPVARSLPSYVPNFNPVAHLAVDVDAGINLIEVQDHITRVMSSFNDILPELGGPQKDGEALRYAEHLMSALQRAANWYRLESLLLQSFIRAAVLATTILTVIQATNPSSRDYSVLRVWNTVLPLVASAFIAIDSILRPSFKNASLLLGEKRIESERYRFWTRTGEYRSRILPDTSMRENARKRFTEHCREIHRECIGSDMSNGSLFTILVGKAKAKTLLGLDPPEALFDHTEEKFNELEANRDEVPRKDLTGGMKSLKQTNGGKEHSPDTSQQQKDEAAERELHRSISHRYTDTEEIFSTMYDDIFLQPEKYIEDRLREKMVEFYTEVPWYALARFWCRLLVVSLTASSAAFASSGLEAWVPVLISATALFEFTISYFQLDERVSDENRAAAELMKVHLWWSGLTVMHTRLYSSEDELVERTENAILAFYEQYARTRVERTKKRYEEENETGCSCMSGTSQTQRN